MNRNNNNNSNNAIIGCHDVATLATLQSNSKNKLIDDEELLKQSIDTCNHSLSSFEREIDGILYVLYEKKLIDAHRLRKAIEDIPEGAYKDASYYEKWGISMANVMLKQGVFSEKEFEERLGPRVESEDKQLFNVGDKVKVKSENIANRWRKPHLRTPGYLFGQSGVIERFVGVFDNPETHAFLGSGSQPLYRVRFLQRKVWPEYHGNENDTIDVEIYQNWLLPVDANTNTSTNNGDDDDDDDDHKVKKVKHHHHKEEEEEDHDHDHDHKHEERSVIEQKAVDNEGASKPYEFIGNALIKTLLDKKVITREELAKKIEHIDSIDERMLGVKVVARAWKDPIFLQSLLEDGTKAVEKTFGINLGGTKLCVIRNTPTSHNVVVCTLCSCYPRQLLGRPPSWYKSRTYRARVVIQPREVLKEFGTILPSDVKVQVHDSTADLRYLIIPQMPERFIDVSEDELHKHITRDSMVTIL